MTTPLSAKPHDHDRCIEDAITAAEQICVRKGVRLTDLRRRVLELIWQSHKPVTAYDLLDRLKKDKRNAAPPTVYRALDFLRENGLVHRLHSLNAFLGCNHPEDVHRGGFLICTNCHAVTEICDSALLRDAIVAEATSRDFQITGTMVEIMGRCSSCRASMDA